MLEIERFGMFWGKNEKADSSQESNPGHLACVASALPLSYDNQIVKAKTKKNKTKKKR